MTIGEMISYLKRMLGNLPDSDIFIAAGDHYAWLNDGVRDTALAVHEGREGLNIFTELETSWDPTATTQASDNTFDVPSDWYAILSIGSFDTDEAVTTATHKTTPVKRCSKVEFDRLDKTVEGYPRKYAMEGTTIYIWPTPTADYLTNLRFYGLMRDRQITSATDTSLSLYIRELWHRTVVKMAAAHGAEAKGWFDRAEKYRRSAKADIITAIDPKSLELAAQAEHLEFAHMPTAGRIGGG